jgi:hypothetical protein
MKYPESNKPGCASCGKPPGDKIIIGKNWICSDCDSEGVLGLKVVELNDRVDRVWRLLEVVAPLMASAICTTEASDKKKALWIKEYNALLSEINPNHA